MTRKELSAKLYLANLKEAKKKYVTLYKDNYREIAKESVVQASALMDVLEQEIKSNIPADIENIH